MSDTVRYLIRHAAVGVALLMAAGCDGGGESLTPPPNADVSGNWILNWTNMRGTVSGIGTLTCSAIGLHATITQTGTSLTGEIVGTWTLTCTAGGQSESETATGGTISSGTVTGNHIHFHLATEDANQDGTVQGNSMSGTATWSADMGPPFGVVTFTGQWSGVRTTTTTALAPSPSVSSNEQSGLTAAIVRLLGGK